MDFYTKLKKTITLIVSSKQYQSYLKRKTPRESYPLFNGSCESCLQPYYQGKNRDKCLRCRVKGFNKQRYLKNKEARLKDEKIVQAENIAVIRENNKVQNNGSHEELDEVSEI